MSKMQTTVTVDGKPLYAWRSGFELLLACNIAALAFWTLRDAGYALTGFPQPLRSVSAADFVADAVMIALLLAGYWWLRRRNARNARKAAMAGGDG